MKRLSTTGRATSQAIRDREDFNTSGSLKGRNTEDGMRPSDSGRLAGEDLEAFQRECRDIDYVVTSYATPIAWHTPDGWHKVAQKFSVTTSRHQGNLYLIHEDG